MDFDKFFASYIECALWASTDEDDIPLEENYSVDDFDPESLEKLRVEAKDFFDGWETILELHRRAQCGRDFWLTRNRHGSGFWDRGTGDIGQKLTEASHVYGEVNLYVGDDGRIYS